MKGKERWIDGEERRLQGMREEEEWWLKVKERWIDEEEELLQGKERWAEEDRMVAGKGEVDKGKGKKKLRKWVVGKCVEDRGRGRIVAGKRMVD